MDRRTIKKYLPYFVDIQKIKNSKWKKRYKIKIKKELEKINISNINYNDEIQVAYMYYIILYLINKITK